MGKKKSATVTELRRSARRYPDLDDDLERLESEGLLIRVKPGGQRSGDASAGRWQFRGGIEEKIAKRLSSRTVDAKGKPYDIPVAIGILAANRRITARSRLRPDSGESAMGRSESKSDSAG